jgi:tRNA-2-methylthio-N6-dimethylallyladenosine synthase
MRTMSLLEEIKFDKVHVAAYSPRPGTVAANWPDDVPHWEKMVRLHAVEALQERIARDLNSAHLGQELEVLVEGTERGKWMGRTRTNKIVFFEPDAGRTVDRTGQLVMLRIYEAGPWSLQGTLTRVVREAPKALFESIRARKQSPGLPLSFAPTPVPLTK